MKKGPPALLVGAVLLWIAIDVGGGALTGIARVEEKRLNETPLAELVDQAVIAHHDRNDKSWTEHASVHSISGTYDKVVFRLRLSEKTQASIRKRMTQAKRADIRNDIRDEVCARPEYKNMLKRGGAVSFSVMTRDGVPLFDAHASGSC